MLQTTNKEYFVLQITLKKTGKTTKVTLKKTGKTTKDIYHKSNHMNHTKWKQTLNDWKRMRERQRNKACFK